MQILDNFVMPVAARTGTRVTKYLTTEQADTLKKLNIGQTIILPALDKVVPAYQRRATEYYIKKLATDAGMELKQFQIGVVPDKGVAIKRTEDKVAEVVAPKS